MNWTAEPQDFPARQFCFVFWHGVYWQTFGGIFISVKSLECQRAG
jgi:hypothetical protein